MKKIISIFFLMAFLLTATGMDALAAGNERPTAVTFPSFVIKAVDRNKLVTIQAENLRKHDTYIVTMGPMGTRGVDGYHAATIQTDGSGELTKTFRIPVELKGSTQISVRLESPYTGFYAYNWFYNVDANLDLVGSPEPMPSPIPWKYSGYPYFFIKSVVQDGSVTITPYNFPPNQTFEVRMNWMHTRGVAGTIVETVTTDSKGNLSDATYLIPDFLDGSYRIAIRLESSTSGYYAYNWFYNNDAP